LFCGFEKTGLRYISGTELISRGEPGLFLTNGEILMVAQQKTGNSLQERINQIQKSSISEDATVTSADAADELVDALDTLLLERALEEHRVALARLNELKLALGKD
jgi:hypothetical protein